MSTTTSDSRGVSWSVVGPFVANQVLATVSGLPLGYYEINVSAAFMGPMDQTMVTNLKLTASGNTLPIMSTSSNTNFVAFRNPTIYINLEGGEDVVVSVNNLSAALGTSAGSVIITRHQ